MWDTLLKIFKDLKEDIHARSTFMLEGRYDITDMKTFMQQYVEDSKDIKPQKLHCLFCIWTPDHVGVHSPRHLPLVQECLELPLGDSWMQLPPEDLQRIQCHCAHTSRPLELQSAETRWSDIMDSMHDLTQVEN